MNASWREQRADDTAWRAPPRLTQAERAAEQDRAAGDRESRTITLPDGSFATGSIALRVLPQGRRVYAYLRWSEEGKTFEKYVGEVDGPTRAENLAQAWSTVREMWPRREEEKVPVPNLNPDESWATSEATRTVMQANRSRDTRPEIALRSAVHALGLRYRVGAKPLPGSRRTADLLFSKAKVAVFVDGCFWHGCPEHYRPAKRNETFWKKKIEANQERDADTDSQLEAAGWRVLRFWEHDDPTYAASRVEAVVRGTQSHAGVETRTSGEHR